MKKLVVLCCLFVFFAIQAKSNIEPWNVPNEVVVGKQPLAIFPVYYNSQPMPMAYLVYCAGHDAGWDDTLNIGVDEAPSLWLITLMYTLEGENAEARGQKIADLSFGLAGYPFRPAIEGNEVYLSKKGVLCKYSISNDAGTVKIQEDSICESSAIAVSKLGRLLFLSEKFDYASPGQIRVFDIESKLFVDTIPAFANVQQTATRASLTETSQLYILSEGVSGATESTVIVADVFGSTITPVDTIYLGISGSNHMAINENIMIVTNNLSEEIVTIDLTTNDIIRRIPLLDASPRESFFYDGKCLVSAFSGKVFQVDYENGTVIDSNDTHGKAEALYADSKALFVTSSMKKGSWDKDSIVNVFIYLLDAEENPEVRVASRPNPVTDFVSITFPTYETVSSSRVIIANPLGDRIIDRELNTTEISNGAVELNTQALQMPNGVYFAEIQSGNSVYRCKFVVSR